MTKTLKYQLNYAILFTIGVVLLFVFLAQNLHQIQQVLQQKNVTSELKFKPIRSVAANQKTFRLETYKTDSAKIDSDKLDDAQLLSQHKNSNSKNLNLAAIKNKIANESTIVDHQIFASPNNIRTGKRIFI